MKKTLSWMLIALAMTSTANAAEKAQSQQKAPPSGVSARELTDWPKEERFFYIMGAYNLLALQSTIAKHHDCVAPEGTSNGSAISLIIDQIRFHDKEWGHLDAVGGIYMAACSLWPDPAVHSK